MLLETCEQSIVNLDKVYEISIMSPYWCVVASHHPGDEGEIILYDGYTEADSQDYCDWLMKQLERVHPDQHIIRNTFDYPSTKEEALARAAAKDSEA